MHNNIPLFTIDEPHSRDLDDAIGVARTKTGWTVRVAIANPSAVVAIGSAEDQAARKQGATIYRGREAAIPMLARSISEEQATLTAGVPRAAMLIDLELDEAGRMVDVQLSLAEITVAQRLAYKDVPEIAADEAHSLHRPMVDAIAIANGFLKQRRARGALAFLDQAQMLLTDEEGRVQRFGAGEMVGHLVVQEMMISANAAVAEFAAKKDVPFLYRCHEPRISAPRGLAAAESFEAWIAGGHATAAAAAERLSLIAQRARYASILTGHYGLNVPAYAHITSPLRRYADLVVQRQLVAMIRGTALPYSQDDMTEIGDDLFAASEAAAESKSEFFKAPLLAAAQAALEADGVHALRGLSDNELGQAVKAGLAGGFAPALVDELLRRMGAGTLVNKVSVRFIDGRKALPPALAEGFMSMVGAKPATAISFLSHARATNAVSDFDVQFEEIAGRTAPTFRATASLREADTGATFIAVVMDSRKKAAEQASALLVLGDLMGVARPVASAVDEKAHELAASFAPLDVKDPPTAQLANPKGELFEHCQKEKLGTPTFTSSATGPSNAPTFVCLVELNVRGESVSARSAEAPTKRQAEALAAQALLDQLLPRGEAADHGRGTAAAAPAAPTDQPSQAAPAGPDRGRPIQLLLEYAQKARLPVPVFEFIEISKTPSVFECRVCLALPEGTIEMRATDASKQGAKAAASARVLERLASSFAA